METAVTGNSIETLAANLSGAPQRRTLDGREYLVSPITIFPPGGGVMNGSKGPLFYSGQVCRANPGAWNDVPITGRHPMSANGKHVSADDPDVLKKQKIGFLVNDHEDNGRRRVWGWLDVENARDYDRREGTSILSDWEAGRLQEVSTGLYTDDSPAENGAHHNGRSYAWTVTSWRPDHLAVLPDQRGACSITDGCGVNNADANQSVLKTAWNKMGQLLGFSVANASDIVDGSVKSSGAKLAWQEGSLEAAQAGAVKGASCGLDCECEDCAEKRTENGGPGSGPQKGSGHGESEKVSSKSVKAGDLIFTGGDWHPVKSVEVEEGYQTTVTLVGSPDVHAAPGQDDVLHYAPKKEVNVKRKLTGNAGRWGNPQSTATGFYKRHGSGTGKGEQHEAAQRGAMVITERDRELGVDAFKQLQETGNNPASWVADEATWDRAKAAADAGGYGGDEYWAVVAHVYKNMGGEVKEVEDQEFDDIVNAFCATGEGGGVDPSCGSGDGGEKDLLGLGPGRDRGEKAAKLRLKEESVREFAGGKKDDLTGLGPGKDLGEAAAKARMKEDTDRAFKGSEDNFGLGKGKDRGERAAQQRKQEETAKAFKGGSDDDLFGLGPGKDLGEKRAKERTKKEEQRVDEAAKEWRKLVGMNAAQLVPQELDSIDDDDAFADLLANVSTGLYRQYDGSMITNNETYNESGDFLDLSQGDSPMTLNATQRKTIVTELATNCACWKGGEETLNEMSDERLIALAKAHKDATENALTANAVKTVLKPPDKLAANEMPAFIKAKIEAKKKKDKTPSDELEDDEAEVEVEDDELDEEETENARRIAANSRRGHRDSTMTLNELFDDPSMPKITVAEAKSAMRFAVNAERSQKVSLVQKLVANVSDDKTREELAGDYMRMSLPKLQKHLAAHPQATHNAQQEESESIGFYFSGIGQPPTANVKEDEDLAANAELMEMPTLDFTKLSGQRKTA